MRLAIVSFTERGGRLNRLLGQAFRERGHEADSFEKRVRTEKTETKTEEAEKEAKKETGKEIEKETEKKAGGLKKQEEDRNPPPVEPVTAGLSEWTRRAFEAYEGLVFVGACGIAVRAVAPFLKDKFTDPAVVAVDERAGFAVSLLSGHAGGANELCRLVADISGAVPVVSTATDVNGLFAVDVFAKQNRLFLKDRTLAKMVSAKILGGGRIPFYSTQVLEGEIPKELMILESPEEFLLAPGVKIAVSEKALLETPFSKTGPLKEPFSENRFFPKDAFSTDRILYLVPKTVALGVGCKRGTKENLISQAVSEAFSEEGIFPEALAAVATIEKKKDEEGLILFAKNRGAPFYWYKGEELLALSGKFSHSDFVKETVGVDCVCERAAVLGSGGGSLLFPKRTGGGIAVAAAKGRKKLTFGKEEVP